MKRNVGQLLTSFFMLFSCCGLSAQEEGTVIEAHSVAMPVQNFVVPGRFGQQAYAVPYMPAVSAFGFSGSNNFSQLRDPSILKDLELVDDQIEQIAEARKKFDLRRRELFNEFAKNTKKLSEQEKLKNLQEDSKELEKEQTEALSDILLPHQLARIKQLNQQMQMQSMGGITGALQHGQLFKELDVTDEQKKRLAEIQKTMHEEIAAKMKEIQAAAKQQALDALTADQRMKLKELTGEELKRDPKDWQEHRQRTFTSGPKK